MFNILPFDLQCIVVLYLDYCEYKPIAFNICDKRKRIELLKYWHKNSKHTVLIYKYSKEYRINGKLHREKGPAIESKYGTSWYNNNKLHRKNGPARYTHGYKEWFINGKRHRDDGPAIESEYGRNIYYIDGEECSDFYYYFCFYWPKKIKKLKC